MPDLPGHRDQHDDRHIELAKEEAGPLGSTAGSMGCPIILACACWGQGWTGHRVACLCDNQVMVAAIGSRSSRQPHLLRCLAFAEASRLNCSVVAMYISTSMNHLADDLSRNRSISFLSKVPQADPVPTQVPLGLMELLCNPQADWISPHWRHQFRSIFRRV